MKNILISVFVLVAVSACSSSYNYYESGVRYTQKGEDCVFYTNESGEHFNSAIKDLDSEKEVVYRNTMCRDLYVHDNAGNLERNDRKIIVDAPESKIEYKPIVKSCKKCGCVKKKHKYIVFNG